MTQALQFHSRIGKNGILEFRVPLSPSDAGADVIVTVQRLGEGTASQQMDWHEFVEKTYGSCEGLDLERHDQGKFEEREAIE